MKRPAVRDIQLQNASRPPSEESFRKLNASELYCPNCKKSMPVREKMLLVLGSGNLDDYVCVKCQTSLGTRTSS